MKSNGNYYAVQSPIEPIEAYNITRDSNLIVITITPGLPDHFPSAYQMNFKFFVDVVSDQVSP